MPWIPSPQVAGSLQKSSLFPWHVPSGEGAPEGRTLAGGIGDQRRVESGLVFQQAVGSDFLAAFLNATLPPSLYCGTAPDASASAPPGVGPPRAAARCTCGGCRSFPADCSCAPFPGRQPRFRIWPRDGSRATSPCAPPRKAGPGAPLRSASYEAQGAPPLPVLCQPGSDTVGIPPGVRLSTINHVPSTPVLAYQLTRNPARAVWFS